MHLRFLLNLCNLFLSDFFFFITGLQVIAKLTFEVKSGKKKSTEFRFLVSVSPIYLRTDFLFFSFWIALWVYQ